MSTSHIPRRRPTSGPADAGWAESCSVCSLRNRFLAAILRSRGSSSSGRRLEREGDPCGDGESDDDELRLRLRFTVVGAGDAEGDVRGGGMRLSGVVDGPAAPRGEPKPNPAGRGEHGAEPAPWGCPKPNPSGDMDAGAPNGSTLWGCCVSGWAIALGGKRGVLVVGESLAVH